MTLEKRPKTPQSPRRIALRILIRGIAIVAILLALALVIFNVGRQRVIAHARKQLAEAHAIADTISKHNQTPETLDRDLVRVLVLDGGGIRGLITLEILAALEEASGKRAAELFDVLAGTSTGGIIAVLLTLPGEDGRPRYTAKELAEFYRQFGTDVFAQPLAYQIFTLDGFVGPKFPRVGLRQKLMDQIGDVHMAELIKPVWFPSYSDTAGEPYFFRSREVPSQFAPGSDEYYVADTIIAATTVPGIFMPMEIGSTDGETVGLILDATIYAPNPIISAVMGTVQLYPDKRIYMVSVGTGGSITPVGVKQSSGWGMAQWLPHVLETMAHADTAFENEFAVLDTLPNGQPLVDRYHRIDKPFDAGWGSWFDVSESNMDALTAFGEKLAQERHAEIEQIARDLVEIGSSTGDIAKDYKETPSP